MGIDAAWVDESGNAIQQVFDPRQHLTFLSTSTWHTREGCCVRFIDPWGNTLFNQAQLPVLLEELSSTHADEADLEARAHLEKVMRLVEKAIGRTHTYLRFVGD